ncbi:hypothetical protein TVAG_046900 [Trichomonas vaginalis G3]|uniref:Uncharacterized protein n=1 Tax=Trichomonas vaginalis (strain ATCC PRA-98 / G3) TaxID=412133 RepID=A2EAR5_TRIV3|nr:hypothetical protein TVAGG3_0958770 [Trichomonas vaginalis G3]EAY10268.1 hypothetical protein TVAG_046900 [Trichomonas vaginalis G3]KAI5487752.1 hypothetical protein TVAGG3_0958770 [Trichomonas vaginalis G3]|eukprot:XP_001322491.1 hypothetical protein [Trichomonas vaginalis G3]
MTDLASFCDAISKKIDNPKDVDALILEYIETFQIEANTLSSFENNQNFSTFLLHIFALLTRNQLPRTTSGQIVLKCIKVLEFLNEISIQNPILLKTIAAHAPFDDLVQKFFKDSVFDAKGKAIYKPQLIVIVKFFALIASESPVIIETPETFSMLYQIVQTYFNQTDSEWALALIAGLIHNCPTGPAFLRTQPKFNKLKNTFAEMLSNRNVAIVLSALTNLVFLFPAQISPDISIKTSINSLKLNNTFPLAIKLSCWIIKELADNSKLSSDDVWALLSTTFTAGPSAFYIFRLLVDIPNAVDTLVDVISSMNCLFAIINTLLDSQYNFISVVGVTFLFAIFSKFDNVVFSNEVKDSFLKALKIVISSDKFVDSDKKEAAIMIMRFLIRSRESTVHVVNILSDNQQKLFVEFQRQVTNNNAYVSVQFFLLLYEVSHFLAAWRSTLIRIAIDSQFPALLTHVLSASRNRSSVEDCILCLQIVCGGMTEDRKYKKNPLVSILTDGHMIANQKLHEDDKSDDLHIDEITQTLQSQINELEVERDCCIRELEALKVDAAQCSLTIETELDQHKDVIEKRQKLKDQESRLKNELEEAQTNLEQRLISNKALQQQLQNLQKTTSERSQKEAGIRTKSNDINNMNIQIVTISEENRKVRDAISHSIDLIEKQKTNRTKYINWLKTGKQRCDKRIKIVTDLEEQINIETKRKEQLENEISISEQQLKQWSDFLKDEEDAKKAEEDQIQELKNELEKIRRDIETNEYKASLRVRTLDQLKEHMIELETQYNEMKLLVKLLHKSTYPNMRIPENVSSLFQLQDT